MACHTVAGMCDEPRRTSAWEASDAVEYFNKSFFMCRKGDHIPLVEITKLNTKQCKSLLIQLQAHFNYFTNLLNSGQFLQWWQCYSQNV